MALFTVFTGSGIGLLAWQHCPMFLRLPTPCLLPAIGWPSTLVSSRLNDIPPYSLLSRALILCRWTSLYIICKSGRTPGVTRRMVTLVSVEKSSTSDDIGKETSDDIGKVLWLCHFQLMNSLQEELSQKLCALVVQGEVPPPQRILRSRDSSFEESFQILVTGLLIAPCPRDVCLASTKARAGGMSSTWS